MKWGFHICVMQDGSIRIMEVHHVGSAAQVSRMLPETFSDAEEAMRWLPGYISTQQIKSKGSFISADKVLAGGK